MRLVVLRPNHDYRKKDKDSQMMHAWLPFIVSTVVLTFVCLIAPEPILRGYFAAYIAVLNVVLGALAIILIASLSGAHWVEWLLTPLRSAVATLPYLVLLSLPLWFNVNSIQSWVVTTDLQQSSAAQQWMQPHWVVLRDMVLLLLWFTIAFSIRLWAWQQPLLLNTRRVAIGLIVLVLSISVFAIDWIMALIEFYTTTMIGFLLFSEQMIAALATGALWLASRRHFLQDAGRVVGNLLMAAVMFHGYCLIMDYLIVWQTNLPNEISGYLRRNGQLMVAVTLFLFLLPLVALLFRRVKTNAKSLGAVALSVLLGHTLMVCWFVSPLFVEQMFGLADGFCAVFLLAIWVWIFCRLCQRFEPVQEEKLS